MGVWRRGGRGFSTLPGEAVVDEGGWTGTVGIAGGDADEVKQSSQRATEMLCFLSTSCLRW